MVRLHKIIEKIVVTILIVVVLVSMAILIDKFY